MSDSECAVCLNTLSTGHNIRVECCGKLFHFDCIKQVVEKTSNKCPLCRADIFSVDICKCTGTSTPYFKCSQFKKNGKCILCSGYKSFDTYLEKMQGKKKK